MLPERVDMLANRVRKRVRHLRKWAKRESLSCYRVYDRDIPEVPVCIDWYQGYVHASVFEHKGREVDPVVLAQLLCDVFEVDDEHVFVKHRRRHRSGGQYTRIDRSDNRIEVQEAGHRFWINLRDFVDTGLYLDHRTTRGMVRDLLSPGQKFLNLFSYTGAFTVYASAAGAQTVSVDMSKVYTEWLADNLALNGMVGEHNAIVRGDILQILNRRELDDDFDVAVVDAPTYSASKKMAQDFDVQRDQAFLINRTLELLRPGGVLFFSTHFRRFRLEPAGIIGASSVEDISESTLPDDFRDKRTHRCFRIVRAE